MYNAIATTTTSFIYDAFAYFVFCLCLCQCFRIKFHKVTKETVFVHSLLMYFEILYYEQTFTFTEHMGQIMTNDACI